jgi:pimeloyl-ACP methyl ester carboxylesterase
VGRVVEASGVGVWPLEIDVSDAVPFPGTHHLGGWICAAPPLDHDRTTVVVSCLAGGTCSTGYYDLQVEGLADYSMARHLAARGLVVVAFDHLGIGASSRADDVFLVTPRVAAAAQDHAFREVAARLGDGTLVAGLAPVTELTTVGLGHSMGGMILTVQQALHGTFDAIAVLGHGGDGLPGVLTDDELHVRTGRGPDELERAIVALARTRFGTTPAVPRKRPVPASFLLPDVPDVVRAAFIAQQAPLLFSCGLTSMIPAASDDVKATITAPVFLAFGDHDLTDEYEASLAKYRSANDATLFVLAGSAHCHNQAGTRAVLWDRIAAWTTGRLIQGAR